MALPIPWYIPISEISQFPIEHEWDSWDPYELLGNAEEGTLNALAGVSDRGAITFAIGCSEWVIYRLLPHLPDHWALSAISYLEAWWALVMGTSAALPPDPTEKEWQGKVLAPVALSLLTINNAWRLAEDGEADAHGAFAERIPLFVLRDTGPFVVWRNKVLQRLEHFHPYDKEDESMGNLVAREILDPRIDLKGVNQNELVRRTLNTMSLNENPYIKWI